MLQSIRNLNGHRIAAKDGSIGSVNDFLFDDRSWEVRYLVVETGNWLPGRRVLVRPAHLGQPSYGQRSFPVELTTEVIESSPPLASDMPVSKQYEVELHKHYAISGFGAGVPAIHDPTDARELGDAHLRSADAVTGYGVDARDGSIGHIDDFMVDDEDWILRYAVVDTRNWLPGKKTLVATDWIEAIDLPSSMVKVDLSREGIESGPEFDATAPISREFEERLFEHHGRPSYWAVCR